MLESTEHRRIVGIGPVISGSKKGEHLYYVDVAYEDGRWKRLAWTKNRRGLDRPAKLEALRIRMQMANIRRSHGRPVVLAHDQDSFLGLVALLRSRFDLTMGQERGEPRTRPELRPARLRPRLSSAGPWAPAPRQEPLAA